MSLLKISLSAGHGLTTSGKQTPDGMKEWEFNAAIVKYMIARLALYQDVATLRLDDSTGKVDIPLQTRSDRSSAWGAHVHIDVHANAYGTGWNDANGIETFVYEFRDADSYELAKEVQSRLVQATGLKDRGVKQGNLHMVREPKASAKILVEAGFMTFKREAELLKTDAYRQKVANCIVDAIVHVYKLKERVSSTKRKYHVSYDLHDEPSKASALKHELIKQGHKNVSVRLVD